MGDELSNDTLFLSIKHARAKLADGCRIIITSLLIFHSSTNAYAISS